MNLIDVDVFRMFKYCKISGTVMRRRVRKKRRPSKMKVTRLQECSTRKSKRGKCYQIMYNLTSQHLKSSIQNYELSDWIVPWWAYFKIHKNISLLCLLKWVPMYINALSPRAVISFWQYCRYPSTAHRLKGNWKGDQSCPFIHILCSCYAHNTFDNTAP